MYPVLDKGFVDLTQFVGGDLSVVNSARVSFSAYTESMTDADIGLVKFLMRERHGSPFEHSTFTFHIKCPIFVAREWMRHRIGCLSGDTLITCVQPSGVRYKRTIKQIYELKYGVRAEARRVKNGKQARDGRTQAWVNVPEGTRRSLPNCQNRNLLVLNEKTNSFEVGRMYDVYESGEKDVFLLTLKSGKRIKATQDHRFLTEIGWQALKEIPVGMTVFTYHPCVALNERMIPPSLRSGIGVWTTMMRSRLLKEIDTCYKCNGLFDSSDLVLDHVVPVKDNIKLALDEDNLAPMCIECHKIKTFVEDQPSRKGMTGAGVKMDEAISVEHVGKEMTYDISMDGPHHNFVANNIVVHNSYNELSMRYAKVEPEFYIPEKQNVRVRIGKPGRYEHVAADPMDAEKYIRLLENSCKAAAQKYLGCLEIGLAPETARNFLPVNTYTEFYWTVNARSLMNFLSLRNTPQALYEIKEYAKVIETIFAERMPVTANAFVENERNVP